jgi:hypothetical protein
MASGVKCLISIFLHRLHFDVEQSVVICQSSTKDQARKRGASLPVGRIQLHIRNYFCKLEAAEREIPQERGRVPSAD